MFKSSAWKNSLKRREFLFRHFPQLYRAVIVESVFGTFSFCLRHESADFIRDNNIIKDMFAITEYICTVSMHCQTRRREGLIELVELAPYAEHCRGSSYSSVPSPCVVETAPEVHRKSAALDRWITTGVKPQSSGTGEFVKMRCQLSFSLAPGRIRIRKRLLKSISTFSTVGPFVPAFFQLKWKFQLKECWERALLL